MNKFVISLSTQLQRRSHIVKEFEREQIQFEFFNAITPNECDQVASLIGLKNYSTNLHPNEVACFLSHVMLWKKAIDDKLEYIVIFEDDIYLGDQAKYFLTDLSWIPEHADIIKLEAFYKKISISDKISPILLKNHRRLLALDKPHMGCGGYILTKKAVKELLDFVIEYKELIPIDHIVFDKYLTIPNKVIYQLYPALCIQDGVLNKGKINFPSSLEVVRNKRKGEVKNTKKLNLYNKLYREIIRFFKQMKYFFSNVSTNKEEKNLIKMKFK